MGPLAPTFPKEKVEQAMAGLGPTSTWSAGQVIGTDANVLQAYENNNIAGEKLPKLWLMLDKPLDTFAAPDRPSLPFCSVERQRTAIRSRPPCPCTPHLN